jgi:putative membrane protein
MDFLFEYYLWIKAFHIFGVIAWMVGLLYLPRLFVYHAKTEVGSSESALLLVMERRLLKIIMLPAMLITFILGFMMLAADGMVDFSSMWIHLKLLLVFVLAGYHGLCVKWAKEFQHGERRHTDKYFRVANEIPAVIMIAIIILVVVKPL